MNPTLVRSESSPQRLVATLGLASFLSGLIIVAAYQITRPPILAYQAQELRAAVFRVLPGITRLERLGYQDGRLLPKAGEGADDTTIFAGYDAAGTLAGYAIPAAGPGFQDTIRLLYGYRPGPRRVVGMEILESRETPGLGDKIYKDAAFVANFQDLAVEPAIQAVKKGRKGAPHEIDAITGATISSKAVVRIINQANRTWLPRLEAAAAPAGP